MEVQNCRACGRLFNYISGQPVCAECKKKAEDKFMEVRTYVRDNPGKTLSEISIEMEVSVQQLKNWVRQERLSFTPESGITIECEQCGASILTGRYCEVCKKKMVNTLEGLYGQVSPRTLRENHSNRMRHLGGTDD